MDNEQVARLLSSLKGLAGSGNVLSYAVSKMADLVATMEPGDFVRSSTNTMSTAPVAHDVWYLNYNENFLGKHIGGFEGKYDYKNYIDSTLAFLSKLTGLRPLKVLLDLSQITTDISTDVFGRLYSAQYANNGTYWINTVAFELLNKGQSIVYPSDGPPSKAINDYVGYIAIPVGQFGTMEVVSIFTETQLAGYQYAEAPTYHTKAPLTDIPDVDKPSLQSTPLIFPDMKNGSGNAIAGQNMCFGRHLIESAYLRPDTPVDNQNTYNSKGGTAYAPTASRDVEVLVQKQKDYSEDVAPKKWMRYWIHRDDTLPVPGEFIGVLCRPVACPPHVWWFQESSPFVYAGNWMETWNFTSGVVDSIILEQNRPDGGIGNLYSVKIQGRLLSVESSDFCEYSVGDRVGILKVASTTATEAFNWNKQVHVKVGGDYTGKYVAVPLTFYKVKQ
jgi:hypothetical protein